ncbi:MAG: hypothetical protein LBH12_06065 [Dysgonamonadaceae bacterium]|jgi:hypothetical protein|nr:hypothetical protein [Dysgonamonadaceae bacterium]
MARYNDFIPENDEKFLVWLKNLTAYISQKYETWNIPVAEIHPLNAQTAAFETALHAAMNPATRTKAAVQAKNDTRNTVKSTIRMFLKAYVTYNRAVTDSDRDNMNLPIHKKGRTPAPIPKGYPFFRIDSSVIRRLSIYFYDSANEKRRKPEGVHGAEIRWGFSDVPVVEPEKLIYSGFDTASPYTIEFTGEDRGRTVYIALRWENTRGEKGPWSEIYNSIIP